MTLARWRGFAPAADRQKKGSNLCATNNQTGVGVLFPRRQVRCDFCLRRPNNALCSLFGGDLRF